MTCVALSFIVKGWGNASTLPLVSSFTHKVPDLSKAIQSGKSTQNAVAYGSTQKNGAEVKSAAPIAKLALSPVDSGAGNRNTRSSWRASLTHRLPEESKATSLG